MRKSLNFGQKLWTNLALGKGRFLAFFKTSISWSKNAVFFFPEYQNMIFSDSILQKRRMTKSSIFGQKRWVIPLGKCRFFGTF